MALFASATDDQWGIRDAMPADAAAIAAIYNLHVRDTIVTFELETVASAEMARRVDEVQARGLPWLVLANQGRVSGYACASPWKTRAGYARTVESSIYLAPVAQGHGQGRRLYAALLERLRHDGVHAVIGGAALPNPASARLHESLGFASVGCLREVGYKLGRWVDVAYWQLLLDDAGHPRCR